jgi:hypothetical protein
MKAIRWLPTPLIHLLHPRGEGVLTSQLATPPPRFGGQCPVGASIKWLQNTPFLQPIDWSTHPLYLVGHGYQAWGGGVLTGDYQQWS